MLYLSRLIARCNWYNICRVFIVVVRLLVIENKWDKYWYLVAIPTGEIYDEAVRIQNLLIESLNMFIKAPPKIHITITPINRLETCNIANLEKIINGVLRNSNFKSFLVEASQFQCFTESNKSLVLKITDNKYLYELQKAIQDELRPMGYINPPEVEKWIFHITILSEIFIENPLPEEEFLKVCKRISLNKSPIRGEVKTLELWRPVFNEDRVINKFYLK